MSSAPTADEIAAWSPDEQDRVRRALDALLPRPTGAARRPRRRIVLLGVTAVGAVVLLPWIVVLSATLPMTTSVGAWRVAWVGFDVALTLALAVSAWSVWRRRQVAVIALAVTAALVGCDMWFDLCLSWGTSEQWVAVATAALVELPLLVILVVAISTMSRRTARVTQRLRGMSGDPLPLWRQPLVMTPPDQVGR